jgi:protein O-GlcNAc transferase
MNHSISIDEALQIAIRHHQEGRIGDAEEIYRAILEIDPHHADATYRMGLLALDLECTREGLGLMRRAIALDPHNEGYHQSYIEKLINTKEDDLLPSNETAVTHPTSDEMVIIEKLFSSEKFQETQQLAKTLIQNYPYSGVAYNVLGVTYRHTGDSKKSMRLLQIAAKFLPSDAAIHYNLGVAFQDVHNYPNAIACFQKALQLNPKFVHAYNNLGTIYLDLCEYEKAINVLKKLLAIKPSYYKGLCNLGLAYKHQGDLHRAIDQYKKALKFSPDSADIHNNLGNALIDRGEFDLAIGSYEKAVALNPNFDEAYGNILFALNYHPDMDATEIFNYYQYYDKKRWNSYRQIQYDYPNSRISARKLKIGYVSPDFKMHPVRLFLEPLLSHHDKSQFEIYAYAQMHSEDIVTDRYRQYVDFWRTTIGMSDDEMSAHIQQDGIDILVDIAGHTAGNRLGVFARKPAPVSVSWLGFGYTTGLSAIDYYLSDNVSVPEGSETLFSETPWKIETPSYVYRPADGMGEVNELPALTNGYITFGTLSRSIRVNHRTIKAWAEVLQKIPSSRLIIDSKNYTDPKTVAILTKQFQKFGIAKSRLRIGYHTPPWDLLREIDIGLDCFPHNSGTTLFEMLYMGIPYVTLADRVSVGRIGSAILEGMNHQEWIACSEEEYVEKLITLASDPIKLASIRKNLRKKMQNSPLMDEPGFARKVERAYREMFNKWAASS